MTAGDEEVRSTAQRRDAKGVIRHGAEWLALWSDPDSMKSAAELRADRDAVHRRAESEKQLAAAARALSGEPGLIVRFSDEIQTSGPDLCVTGIADDVERQDLAAARGAVDSRALFRRHHDRSTHDRLAPSQPDARRLYDLCERVRCEALGALVFAGVEHNLVARHYARLRRLDLLNAHLASLVPLAEALRMVMRDSLLDRTDPSIQTSAFWMWDRWLRDRFSPALRALRRERDDQPAFAKRSAALIEDIFTALGTRDDGRRRREPTVPGNRGQDPDGSAEGRQADDAGDVYEPGGRLFAEEVHQAVPVPADVPAPAPYRAFTTSHDVVVHADTLADTVALRAARSALDAKRGEFRREFARLAARLQRRLMARQSRAWSFDLEEGLVDASRLDRVVVNPGFAAAYKQEEDTDFPDTAVTLLIDNSGSMRGKPIETACLVADMIASALEHCGIKMEVLGYTTRRWKGGESARDWRRAGRPESPGRLNDLLHVVYKSADEPLRRARLNLCAMLSPELLKENIDGEALIWAARRLLQRPEPRRVLIVISDGAPVDQATLESNDDRRILDRHLRQVIGEIERTTPIELAAIGVKHDAGDYYRRSVCIDRVELLGTSLVGMLDSLLDSATGS